MNRSLASIILILLVIWFGYWLVAILAYSHKSKINVQNVLFLDFDGVLVTNAYLDSLSPDQQKDKYGFVFNPSCAKALNAFIEKSGAKIVVTSSWINDMSLGKMRRMWKYRGMSGEILCILRSNSYDRGHAIDTWLSSHGNPDYMIIDDMDYKQILLKQKEHLITTDGHAGLTIDDIQKFK